MGDLVKFVGPRFAGGHAVFINPISVAAVIDYQDDDEALAQVWINGSQYPILVAGNSIAVAAKLKEGAA